MLVSHRHRFIYTKTMKTAGTSVESYFERFCMPDGEWTLSHGREAQVSASGIVGYRGGDKPSECMWWHHMSAASIREQLGPDLWSSYFKFCVVRNPFEKAVSHFYFLRFVNGETAHDPASDRLRFEHWLETANLAADRNVYLLDGLVCMDAIVRYENLGPDLEKICGRLGLPWEPARLPTFKAGIRPSWSSLDKLYTARSEEIVRAACAFELQTFGYTFGLVSPVSP